jgi:hypothetical protein
LPDDIAQHVRAQCEDVPRHVLESLALAWYQSGELGEEQLRRLLGYSTRIRVHAFFSFPIQAFIDEPQKVDALLDQPPGAQYSLRTSL